MPDRFALCYWPIPFRAQFIRYILAYAGARWEEPDSADWLGLYRGAIADQPGPFMAPPLLHDREADLWISQMPAICSYLGEIFDLMPGTPEKNALTHKVLGDCTDVIQGMTCHCGASMWTQEGWDAYAETRLPRWLQIFEETGRRHGLNANAGSLLGAPEPGVADLACAALWVTIADLLPQLNGLLTAQAPNVLALSNRLADTPAIAALRSEQAAAWGDVWCSGQIEDSLRSVLDD